MKIIVLAKKIVEFADRLEHYDSVTNYVYDGEINAFGFEDENAEATYVANRIEQLICDGHPDVEETITENSIAVIARNRYVFNCLERELTNRNIPFYLRKRWQELRMNLIL